MQIKPIKSELDYRNALNRLELIFDVAVNTSEGDEAEIHPRNRPTVVF